MYLEFFNLHRKPFELAPNPEFLYLSDEHRRAISYLEHGLTSSNGFILLTGEVGSGKTTLLHNLIRSIGNNIVFAKVFNTKIDPEHMLSLINHDFGLNTEGKDRAQLLHQLQEFLIAQYAAGKKAVLVIDEAQNLSAELLEEIRLLTNLETAEEKLLQVVLVGQPELREVLAASSLMQLRQRVSINCHLRPLQRQDVGKYISWRLEKAGNADALLLTPDALDLVYKVTKGVPRLINILGEYILIDSFIVRENNVDEERVQAIIKDIQFKTFYWGEEASGGNGHGPSATQTAPAPGAVGAIGAPGSSGQPAAPVPQVMVRILRNIDRRLQVIERHFYQDSAAENPGPTNAGLLDTMTTMTAQLSRLEDRLEQHLGSGTDDSRDWENDGEELLLQDEVRAEEEIPGTEAPAEDGASSGESASQPTLTEDAPADIPQDTAKNSTADSMGLGREYFDH